MSWQSQVLALSKKYGSAAKFAAKTFLSTVVPGSSAIIELVEQAFDAVQQSAQDEWEINLSKQLQTTLENQARLEQVLAILADDLPELVAQIANLQKLPETAQEILLIARANDVHCQEAIRKIDVIAQRFDRLEQQGQDILERQKYSTEMIEEILPIVKKVAGAKDGLVNTNFCPWCNRLSSFTQPSAKETAFFIATRALRSYSIVTMVGDIYKMASTEKFAFLQVCTHCRKGVLRCPYCENVDADDGPSIRCSICKKIYFHF